MNVKKRAEKYLLVLIGVFIFSAFVIYYKYWKILPNWHLLGQCGNFIIKHGSIWGTVMDDKLHIKDKLSELYSTCKIGLEKSTKIGQRMLSASRVNTSLKNSYKRLGILAFEALKDKDLVLEHSDVEKLVKEIEELKKNLS